MQNIDFIKMHGLGNDFVVIDKRINNIEISKEFINVGLGTPILTVMCMSLGDFSRVWKKLRLECRMASETARCAARL